MALAITVGGFFGQAITQELVTRLFSDVVSRRQERASVGDAYHTLKKARPNLHFALEISGKLPITDVSLLIERREIKQAFQECDMLLRSRQPPVQALVYDDQPTQQVVIAAEAEAPPGTEVAALTETEAVVAGVGDDLAAVAEFLLRQFCSPFVPIVNTARGAVRSVSSSLGITTDDEQSFSNDDIKRFEGFAEMAISFIENLKFSYLVRDNKDFKPLIRELLEGKQWQYDMVQVQESRNQHLLIIPMNTEEHGVLAALGFRSYDAEVPTKCFQVLMLLRISESTDIVDTIKKCLKSLGPHFESSAQVAIGELSQVLHMSNTSSSGIGNHALPPSHLYEMRPDPVCCQGNDKVIPSRQDSYRFPEEVLFVSFDCNVSAIDQYNEGSSTDKAETNIGWPLLKVQAVFKPHFSEEGGEIGVWHSNAEHREDMKGTSPQQVGQMVLTNAISCFICHDVTDYAFCWISPHGGSTFAVKLEKPLTEDQKELLYKRRGSQAMLLLRFLGFEVVEVPSSGCSSRGERPNKRRFDQLSGLQTIEPSPVASRRPRVAPDFTN